MSSALGSAFDGNPLTSESPEVWARLVELLAPPAMLVCIEARLGPELRSRVEPGDIWQETLLAVWNARAQCEWRGMRAFRRYVLAVAENRIRDAADRRGAQKRGGDRAGASLDAQVEASRIDAAGGGSSAALLGALPLSTTTPSRLAEAAEHARCMRLALEALADDVREVVRLRLFEELEVETVAERLGLGVSAVKHRARRGALAYQRELVRRLGAAPDAA